MCFPNASLIDAEYIEDGYHVSGTVNVLVTDAGSATGYIDIGLPTALDILRDATQREILTSRQRSAAVISIIKWCKEDSNSFSKIIGELDESEKSASGVRDTLAYANALYSGYSDGYSAS